MRGRPIRSLRRKGPLDPDPGQNTEDETTLSEDLQNSVSLIQEQWANCPDFQCHQVVIQKVPVAVIFVRGLVNTELLEMGVMEPITKFTGMDFTVENLRTVLSVIPADIETDITVINQSIADGKVTILVHGQRQALTVDISKFPSRAIEPPQVEPVINGPQEGFVESVETNLALLRKRLRTPRLKVHSQRIGQITKTTVLVVYVDGIANPTVTDEVLRRLERIDIDGIIDTNYIRELTDDHPYSPFRTSEVTERPDRTVAALLQGRVVIMVDGAPFVISVPVVFIGALASGEDYYSHYMVAVQVRILRHGLYWASLLLPSLYIALLAYNPNLIPTALLISLAAQHEGIPFPTVVEALFMQTAFEAIREAGIRLPRAVGQSVSVVGALVIGDAAVNANLVSPGMVIVVATAGVASYSIPSQDLVSTNRLLQFPFMIMASFLGLYGIVVLGMVLVIHMVSLESLGTPYMAPIAPFSRDELKDAFVRAPWWAMSRRPTSYKPMNDIRNRTPIPGRRMSNKQR